MYTIMCSKDGKRWSRTMFVFTDLESAQKSVDTLNDAFEDKHQYKVKEGV